MKKILSLFLILCIVVSLVVTVPVVAYEESASSGGGGSSAGSSGSTIASGGWFTITGKITLPRSVKMDKKSFFRIYIQIENKSGTYSSTESFFKLSDEECIYECDVPNNYKDDEFLISYHYGSYTGDYNKEFPSEPTNPLPYYSNGGSSSGGSSGGSGGGKVRVSGYDEAYPENLLYNKLIYVDSKKGTFLKSNAYAFKCNNGTVTTNIVLAENGDVSAPNIIGGYFIDTLSHHIGDMRVQLLDEKAQKLVSSQIVSAENGKYIFNDVPDGKYILSTVYNNTNYYYTGKKLDANVAEAKIIDTSITPISYENDIYYDNIFPTNINCLIRDCIINSRQSDAVIGVYDIYGNLKSEFDSNATINITFSPFILSINGEFVSEYTFGSEMKIINTTDKFCNAKTVNSKFRNTLERAIRAKYDVIIVDISQDEYLINDISVANNYITAELIRNDDTTNIDMIYYGVYQEGRLIDLIADSLSVKYGRTNVKSSRQINISENQDIEIKVFIWRNRFIPMTKAKDIKFTEE